MRTQEDKMNNMTKEELEVYHAICTARAGTKVTESWLVSITSQSLGSVGLALENLNRRKLITSQRDMTYELW